VLLFVALVLGEVVAVDEEAQLLAPVLVVLVLVALVFHTDLYS
jgi:hypothetical protein